MTSQVTDAWVADDAMTVLPDGNPVLVPGFGSS
jgi:hypothetical protein